MPLDGFRAVKSPMPDGLTLKKIESPSYETYRDLHNRVGAPYGWDKRARINDAAAMAALVGSPGAEIWQFFNSATSIGYSLFTRAPDKTAELEDFGFFPEYCGHGYGEFFLPKILERMAALGIKKVWLTSRSTNHPKVVPFYQKMGFRVIHQAPVPEGT